MNPTRTACIKAFLINNTHKDLADLYTPDMECQVLVAQDGGQIVEGSRGQKAYTDGLQTWYSFRIPKNAATEPEYEDIPMNYNLDLHTLGIGMTGWNWKDKISKWVAYDFDALIGHSELHTRKLTENDLQDIQKAVDNTPWVTIRRSTSGKGLHLYVFLPDIPTANHTEHAALARSILGRLSCHANFDLQSKVDALGGVLWQWHRKMVGTEGLQLIKRGCQFTEIPANWREHLEVVQGKRARPKAHIYIDAEMLANINKSDFKEMEEKFEKLTGQRNFIKLDTEHQRILEFLQSHNIYCVWDSSRWMLITHAHGLKLAYDGLKLRGIYKTISPGTDLSTPNCFCYPLKNGGFVVRRYTPGIAEAETWQQDSKGWTRCYFNTTPDLYTAAKSNSGEMDERNFFHFNSAKDAMATAVALGAPRAECNLSEIVHHSKARMKVTNTRKLVVEIQRGPHSEEASVMRGWICDKSKGWWHKVFQGSYDLFSEPESPTIEDDLRHIVSEEQLKDIGWLVMGNEGWQVESWQHVKTYLRGKHKLDAKAVDSILAYHIGNAWILVNRPFKDEYLVGRRWNRKGAKLAFTPTLDLDNLSFPTWQRILNHCGASLDEYVKESNWGKENGIVTGAEYLKYWIASMFQYPEKPLPYLFLFGPQDQGKSTFHDSLEILMTAGYERADNALASSSGFNGELEGCVLAVIEETNMKGNKVASNRIKDWVTSRLLPIHIKGQTPFHLPNTTHWVQCVPSDTWIQTTEGPRQVQELIDKRINIIVNGETFLSEKGFFYSGTKDIYRITTSRGYVFESSYDHQVLCHYKALNLFRKVCDLEPGDQLQLNCHKNLSWDGPGDYDQGYVLGFLMGDGSFRTRKTQNDFDPVLYIYEDIDILDYLSNVLDQCNVLRREDGGYTIAGLQLKELCREFDFDTKKLPSNFEKNSSDFLEGFLSGLFDTDGGFSFERNRIALYQSNLELLQIVQRILLRLGISSAIYKSRGSRTLTICKNKRPTISKTSYQLTIISKDNINTFEERIGFQIPRKAKLLRERREYRKRKSTSFTTEVLSIEKIRTDHVYDTRVDKIHAFDGNGFILHNCGNEMSAAPIFSGDTRITMIRVGHLKDEDRIGSDEFKKLLIKEAPDFLASLLSLEIPATRDRLNIPVIITQDKRDLEQANENVYERFIREKCYAYPGKFTLIGDLFDELNRYAEPAEKISLSRKGIAAEIRQAGFITGRVRPSADFAAGNLSLQPPPPDSNGDGPHYILKGQYLEIVTSKKEEKNESR